MNWIEKTPEIGDTVKVEFTKFTNLGIKVGVIERVAHGDFVIDFGDMKRFLPKQSSYLVRTNLNY